MRLLILALVLALSGCGPDVAAWVGTYKGSGTINAGRQPEPLSGTLAVTADGRFTLTSDAVAPDNRVWTCALTASMATAAQATFAVPTTCPLGVTPTDNCTHTVTINMATLNKSGNDVDGTISGRVSSACTSTTANDWLLSFGGTKQ
ncbi:MAG: hypothetical protein QM817_00840 [Archangium sp.]